MGKGKGGKKKRLPQQTQEGILTFMRDRSLRKKKSVVVVPRRESRGGGGAGSWCLGSWRWPLSPGSGKILWRGERRKGRESSFSIPAGRKDDPAGILLHRDSGKKGKMDTFLESA